MSKQWNFIVNDCEVVSYIPSIVVHFIREKPWNTQNYKDGWQKWHGP